jgi:hypothetical protein
VTLLASLSYNFYIILPNTLSLLLPFDFILYPQLLVLYFHYLYIFYASLFAPTHYYPCLYLLYTLGLFFNTHLLYSPVINNLFSIVHLLFPLDSLFTSLATTLSSPLAFILYSPSLLCLASNLYTHILFPLDSILHLTLHLSYFLYLRYFILQ